MRRRFAFVLVAGLFATAATAGAIAPPSEMTTPAAMPIAGGCKSASSCEDAVRMWCGGYSRADGDGDGIPCENVCSSKREVDAIKAEIGC